METKLDIENFEGIVLTHEWVRWPDGRQYVAFAGTVTIMSALQAVGWEPTGHNSANWLARISGPKTSVNLMGCQVRAVLQGSLLDLLDDGMADVYRVA